MSSLGGSLLGEHRLREAAFRRAGSRTARASGRAPPAPSRAPRTRSPTLPASSAISVRSTRGTLSRRQSGWPAAARRARPRPRTPRPRPLELLDRAGLTQVAGPSSSASQALGCVAHEHAAHRRAHRPPRLRLGLAHLAQHVGGHLQRAPRAREESVASASPARACSASSSASGQAARWTEPSCHHDHTSSHTNGRNGANSRWKTDSDSRSARLTEPATAGSAS